MRNKKLWLLTCCAGVCWGILASAQPAASGGDDQEKALQALRHAEAVPATNHPSAAKAAQKPPVKQEQPQGEVKYDVDKEVKEALAEKARIQKEEQKELAKERRQKGEIDVRQAKEATKVADQPAAADSSGMANADDQNAALQALRHDQPVPKMPDQVSPVASAPNVPTAPPLEATPVIASAPPLDPAPPAASAVAADPVSNAAPARIVAPEPAITAAPASLDDQSRALEALRRAESEPIPLEHVAPAAVTPVVPNVPDAPVVAAAQEVAVAPAAPVAAVAPASVDDQSKALEALRRAESEPLVLDHAAPAASAPASAEVQSNPAGVQDKEAQLIEAQRRRAAAEEQVRADVAAQAEAATRQQREDEMKIQQAIAAEKAAAEQARLDKVAQEEAARKQQEQDQLRVQQAIAAENAAIEEARIAKAQREAAEQARIVKAEQDAAAAAQRKFQSDTTRRIELLNKDTQTPAGPVVLTAKELKLADLLRRYQADQITPFEYHTERAKIVAEP
jgi:hypothetical protein